LAQVGPPNNVGTLIRNHAKLVVCNFNDRANITSGDLDQFLRDDMKPYIREQVNVAAAAGQLLDAAKGGLDAAKGKLDASKSFLGGEGGKGLDLHLPKFPFGSKKADALTQSRRMPFLHCFSVLLNFSS
jgi:hypothetical protein